MGKEQQEQLKEKRKKLIEKLDVDTSVPHYVSTKDKSVFYRPEETSNDKFSKNLEQTLNKWKEKGYSKYEGKYEDIPNNIFMRYLIKDEDNKIKVRNGGLILQNKPNDKYFMLMGVAKRRFSVQYESIYQLYLNEEQIKKQKEKQKEKDKKKQDKEEEKKKKQQEKEKQQEQKKQEQEKKQKEKEEKKKQQEEKKRKEQEEQQKQKQEKEKREQEKKQKEKEEKKKQKEEKKQKEQQQKKEEEVKDQDKQQEPKKKKLTEEEMDKILNEYYYEKQNFFGRDKLYKIIQDAGHKIPRAFVQKWLSKQELYQLTKPTKKRSNFTRIIPKAPFNVVQIDLFTYGDEIITLNFIDLFSKWVDSVILPNKTAKAVINGLKKILKNAPMKPKLIQSDNGNEFSNKQMTKYLNEEGIKQIFSTPHTPQSQGQIERLQRTLKSYLQKLTLQDKKITEEQINKFDDNYNNMEHSTTKMTPLQALKPENREKVLKNIEKNKATNIKENKDDLEVGDDVRIELTKENKVSSKGPVNWSEEIFKIMRIKKPKKDPLKPIKYEIKDKKGEKIKGIFYREELQKVNEVENTDKTKVKYEIERIVGKKKEKGKEYYKVKWKNYPSSENTWESKEKLLEDGLKDEIEKWDKAYDDIQKQKKKRKKK